MKINFELDAKLLAGIALGASIVCGAMYIKPIKAQAVTSLSGQYGCILNKNFAGYNVADVTSNNTGSITGSNYMMYMDFTNSGFQVNVIGLKTWGVSSIVTGSATVTNGSLSVSAGPLTNSFTATATLVDTQLNVTDHLTFNLMSVNGGNTLMLQQGLGGNGDGEPSTGVCNRI